MQPVQLRQLKQGDLFLPVGSQTERFIAGNVNGTAVLMLLDGEHRFGFSKTEDWTRAAGLRVHKIAFEADISSAVSMRETGIGALLIGQKGKFVLGMDNHSIHPVRIDGEILPEETQEHDVAFSRWRIVTDDDPRAVLYSSPGFIA